MSESDASPQAERLRPALSVLARMKVLHVNEQRPAAESANATAASWLALAVKNGADAVASDPSGRTVAAARAVALGAALYGALASLPGHADHDSERLLRAASAAQADLEGGEDGSGLLRALRSTGRAVALVGTTAHAEGAETKIADHLVSALAAAAAGAALLDPSITDLNGGHDA